MQEAPDDLKFLLEDFESIPWRRRKWEREGVLRMIVEKCDNQAYLLFHDSQRELLNSMARGRQPSFVGSMGIGQDESRPKAKRASMLPDRPVIDEKGLSFSGTFSLRLRIAITVTFACFFSVFGVRTSLSVA